MVRKYDTVYRTANSAIETELTNLRNSIVPTISSPTWKDEVADWHKKNLEKIQGKTKKIKEKTDILHDLTREISPSELERNVAYTLRMIEEAKSATRFRVEILYDYDYYDEVIICPQ